MSTQDISPQAHQTFAQATKILEQMQSYPTTPDPHIMQLWYVQQAALFAEVKTAAEQFQQLDPTHRKGIVEKYPACEDLVNTWTFLCAAEPEPGPIL